MKKVIFAVVLGVVAVAMLGVPALAAGQRLPVLTLPLELRCGNTSGGGSVMLYDSKAPNRMQMELVLEGALPHRSYDVICVTYQYDGTSYSNFSTRTVGTVHTNKAGDSRGAYTLSVAASGDYFLRLELRLDGDLLQYAAGTWPATISFD